MIRLIPMALLAFVLAAVASGCGGQTEEHRARGEVQAVDAGARQITIDHEDIPGYMKAMTMTFEVAPGVALEDVSAGERVEFRVKEEGGVYTVTTLRPAGG